MRNAIWSLNSLYVWDEFFNMCIQIFLYPLKGTSIRVCAWWGGFRQSCRRKNLICWSLPIVHDVAPLIELRVATPDSNSSEWPTAPRNTRTLSRVAWWSYEGNVGSCYLRRIWLARLWTPTITCLHSLWWLMIVTVLWSNYQSCRFLGLCYRNGQIVVLVVVVRHLYRIRSA